MKTFIRTLLPVALALGPVFAFAQESELELDALSFGLGVRF